MAAADFAAARTETRGESLGLSGWKLRADGGYCYGAELFGRREEEMWQTFFMPARVCWREKDTCQRFKRRSKSCVENTVVYSRGDGVYFLVKTWKISVT